MATRTACACPCGCERYDNTRLSTASFGGLINSGPLAGLQFAQNGVLSPFVNGVPTGTPGTQIGGVGAYFTDTWAWSGLNMGQGFGRFDYDVTDNTKAFVELAVGSATYSAVNSAASENVYLNNVAVGYNNAYLAGVAGIQPQYASVIADELAASPLSSFDFSKMTTPEDNFPAPEDLSRESQDLLITGLNGLWGRYKWSFGYEWQRSVTATQQLNTVSEPRLYAALNAVVDPATGQVVCNAALVNPSVYGSCVPLDVFGPSASSQAAFDYIDTEAGSWVTYGMHDVTASLVGSPLSDWAGPINMAWSGEWRRLSYEVTSNALPTASVDCTGIQFNCTSGTPYYYTGATDDFPAAHEEVSELAYETEVPLLKNAEWAKSIDLNGAARFTDYSTSGSVWTWKLGGIWALNDSLTLRVTRSYDIRAPGLQDLFAPETVAVTSFLDEHTVVSGNTLSISQGNPDLKPEKAATWTAGFVWTPQYFHGGKLSMDFYHIDIGDALVNSDTRQPATQLACEASGGTSSICSLYVRPYPYSDTSADNFPTEIINEELNSAELLAYGMDTELDYFRSISGHGLLGRLLVNYQPHLIYNMGPAGTVDAGDAADGVGGLGPTPSVRGVFGLNYEVTHSVSLIMQERYRNSLKQNGSPLIYIITPALRPAYYTNATLSYKLGAGDGKLSMFFNIRNLFNRQPELWASSGGGSQIGAFGGWAQGDDAIGRYFTLGLRYRVD